VDDISFNIEKGEIFGMLGPNGAGKTTTIFILCTLLKPTGGSAKVAGYDVVKDELNVRRNIGIVFQDVVIDDRLTAMENLSVHAHLYSMSKEEWFPRAEELLELVELGDRKNELVAHYSGGMKRRLEIVRGLLNQPKVLFLDEPSLGLDPQTRLWLINHIKQLNKETEITILVSSHYMDEIDKLANRILIIDHGKEVILDTPSDLKNRLGQDVLRLKGKPDEEIIQSLKELSFVNDVKVSSEGIEIGVSIPGGEAVPDLMKVVYNHNYPFESLTMQRPTLEDVFIYYTGKSLREESMDTMKIKMGRRKRR
jgi:ABC-2 type transport system ATP-binding protein